MTNVFQTMYGRLTDLLTNEQAYSIKPPNGDTAPRFKKPPTMQATPSSKWDSSLGPNPQSGSRIVSVHRRPILTAVQQYANYINGEPTDSSVAGDVSPTNDSGFYLQDDRIPNVDPTGKKDWQADPHNADPSMSRPSANLGYPVVPQTGWESMVEVNGLFDRDVTEVNTPEIMPTQRAYQGSEDQYAEAPMWLLGGSTIGPLQSRFINGKNQPPSKDDQYIETHPNAVTHTDTAEDYGHALLVPTPVDYSLSVGNEGTDRLVTQQ